MRLLTIIALCVLTTIAAPTRPSVRLSGDIVDPFGFAVPNAQVELVAREGPHFRASTSREGKYVINEVPPGSYSIVVSCSGFVTQRRTIEIEEGATAQSDFGLMAGYNHDAIPTELKGVVRGPNNSPVIGASVTAENFFNERIKTQAKTNENGSYKFSLDFPGQYLVRVSKPGFLAEVKIVVVEARLPREIHQFDYDLKSLDIPASANRLLPRQPLGEARMQPSKMP